MPTVSLEVSGNMSESADKLMKDMLSASEKSKITHQSALKFLNTLDEIIKESQDTIKDCSAIMAKQLDVVNQQDLNVYMTKFDSCAENFAALHAFVAAGAKRNKTVPELTAEIKQNLPAATIQKLETSRDTAMKFRELAKTAYRGIKKNQDSMLLYLKGIGQKINEEKAASNQPSASSNPSFSVYGSMQQASQQRAQEAKQQARQNGPVSNENRRENK